MCSVVYIIWTLSFIYTFIDIFSVLNNIDFKYEKYKFSEKQENEAIPLLRTDMALNY